MDTVKMSCWLVFGRNGVERMTKKNPALYRGEKSIQVNMQVPVAVFQEPNLVATIVMTGQKPPEVKAEIEADIATALEAIPNIHFTITEGETK